MRFNSLVTSPKGGTTTLVCQSIAVIFIIYPEFWTECECCVSLRNAVQFTVQEQHDWWKEGVFVSRCSGTYCSGVLTREWHIQPCCKVWHKSLKWYLMFFCFFLPWKSTDPWGHRSVQISWTDLLCRRTVCCNFLMILVAEQNLAVMELQSRDSWDNWVSIIELVLVVTLYFSFPYFLF